LGVMSGCRWSRRTHSTSSCVLESDSRPLMSHENSDSSRRRVRGGDADVRPGCAGRGRGQGRGRGPELLGCGRAPLPDVRVPDENPSAVDSRRWCGSTDGYRRDGRRSSNLPFSSGSNVTRRSAEWRADRGGRAYLAETLSRPLPRQVDWDRAQ
jgi:hypothetical protein